MAGASLKKRASDSYWIAYWYDEMTRKRVERKIKTPIPLVKNKRNAERAKIAADELEAEYYANTSTGTRRNGRCTWLQFKRRCDAEYFPTRSKGYATKTRSAMARLDDAIKITYLDEIDASVLSTVAGIWQRSQKRPLSLVTVRGYLKHLQAVFNWAHEIGILDETPRFPKIDIRRERKMRGRPITGEEVGRILEATRGVDFGDDWRFLIAGLYASGLRIGEALQLSWTSDGPGCWVDTSGADWFVVWPSHSHKAKRDDVTVVVPEFRAVLESVPVEDRRGRVFDPRGLTSGNRGMVQSHIERTLRKFGRLANVAVGVYETGKYAGQTKYATAHDFRKAFGFRWASHVLPQDLLELMRHSRIETTMEYYVGSRARAVASVVRDIPPDATFVAELTPDKQRVEH